MAGIKYGGLVRSGLIIWLFVVAALLTQPASAADVDGQWTAWSKLSTPCTKSCGAGTMEKIRTCTNPKPEGQGLQCKNKLGQKADMEKYKVMCNTHSCWSTDPQWNDWENCSKECGIGTRNRTAIKINGWINGTDPEFDEEECNTWNKSSCPDPCNDVNCQDYAVCVDISNETMPMTKCQCLDTYELQEDGSCSRPKPTPPTPRPIPTMAAEQKQVATVISKTASSVLIFFVTLTLCLFLALRVFTTDRIIQMNMEIALLAGHLVLLAPPSTTENEMMCKIVSILLHLFFLACFMFMMLEAVHMYTLVAYVVKKDGLFNWKLNIGIGWGISLIIVGLSVAFEWDNYGASYHCWLRMDTGLLIAQQLPIIVLILMTFTLIEAAGAAEYKPLKGMDKRQLTSAKFSQRTNLIIVPMVYAHWMLGTLSEYQQNLALYSIFSVMNGWLGAMVFFFHCSNNQKVRQKLSQGYKNMRASVGN